MIVLLLFHPETEDRNSPNEIASGEAMALAITSRIVSGVVIVDVSGRLCFLEFALRDHINGLLVEGHRKFVLNLADVPYIDSFGLGQLITIWTSVRSRG
ncbi:MAG: STAS domain-containing protein, partial [Acidobacteria bacterium]|nr:STAS domain-containing protein [Acidobacteriota bacterium]